MGRGHLHYLPCEGKGRENCVYTGDASKDHRRHCEEELYPPPEKAMEELLHTEFWTTIGWEDPCTDDERILFSKCPFQCDAPKHDEPDNSALYFLLGAWHLPELKPEVDAMLMDTSLSASTLSIHGNLTAFLYWITLGLCMDNRGRSCCTRVMSLPSTGVRTNFLALITPATSTARRDL